MRLRDSSEPAAQAVHPSLTASAPGSGAGGGRQKEKKSRTPRGWQSVKGRAGLEGRPQEKLLYSRWGDDFCWSLARFTRSFNFG